MMKLIWIVLGFVFAISWFCGWMLLNPIFKFADPDFIISEMPIYWQLAFSFIFGGFIFAFICFVSKGFLSNKSEAK